MTCDMCGLWHHAKCEGVNQQAYNAIGAGASVGVKWFCRKCDKYARAFMTSLQKLSERQDKLEEKMEAMEGSVKESVELCNEKIEMVANSVVGQAVAESAREMRERETRKNNLIIFKVPMCEAEDLKTRIDEDKKLYADKLHQRQMRPSVLLQVSNRKNRDRQSDRWTDRKTQ